MNKVSVLIPAYNSSEFITDTLDSCLAQGDLVGEIVVVDDGSTDDTSAMVTTWKNRHPDLDVTLIQTENRGACHARNVAFENSRFEWIQWLDADDLLGEGKLKAQLNWLIQHPQGLAACPWFKFRKAPHDVEAGEDWSSLPEMSTPSEWLVSRTMMMPAAWLGHRSLFEQIGPWVEGLRINQDGEFFTRAITKSSSVGFMSDIEVHYRIGQGASVSHWNPEKADSLFETCTSFEQHVLSCDPSLRHLVAERYQDFIHRVYPNAPEQRKKARQKVKEFATGPIANHQLVSPLARTVSKLIGWKAFLRLRHWTWSFRYPQS